MSDHFGALDYVVFIGMLMISTIIGLYYAWKDRKNTDENEFLRGGKHMSVLPVSISIMASFLPSTCFIGFPTVVYGTGTTLWVLIIPATLAAVVACEVFIPVFYRMNLGSVNEYIYKRFKSKNLQIITNLSTLLCMIPFFGVELFAPSIALSIVTDMSITASILVIGFIVTIYTSMGGLKGVIWTDFFQFMIMIFGLMAVLIRGANISGGMAAAFQKAHTGGRIEFWNMDFDIYSINSFWTLFIGFFVLYSGTFSVSQIQVQRAICMPTLASAKKALYCAIPGYITTISLTVMTGIVMYARYYDCDPLLTGRVTRPDQLLPFYVMDIFEDDYPGLPGAFVGLIFGSSLSTLSSGMNAMASIIWDDYAKKALTFVPDQYSVYATKVLAVIIGIVSISLAFVAKGTQNIVEAAISLYGSSNGPIFGLFCLGLFFPWANAIGGAAGLIIGQVLCFWMTIGWVSDKRNPASMSLPLTTENCEAYNISNPYNITGAPLSIMRDYKIPDYYPKGIEVINHVSPYFVPVIGYIVCIIVGNVVSLATKGNKNQRLDKDLINLRVCYYMEKLLPRSWRQLTNDRPVRTHPSRDRNTLNNQSTVRPMIAMRQMSKTPDEAFAEDLDDEPDGQHSNNPLRGFADKNTSI